MSDENIFNPEAIAREADAAAMRSAASGRCEPNPHAAGTVAARVWDAAFQRYLVLHSAPADCEGGA